MKMISSMLIPTQQKMNLVVQMKNLAVKTNRTYKIQTLLNSWSHVLRHILRTIIHKHCGHRELQLPKGTSFISMERNEKSSDD